MVVALNTVAKQTVRYQGFSPDVCDINAVINAIEQKKNILPGVPSSRCLHMAHEVFLARDSHGT